MSLLLIIIILIILVAVDGMLIRATGIQGSEAY
jgi:hypothetical protein